MLRLGRKGRRIYEITKTKDGLNDKFEFVQKQANDTLYTITEVQQKTSDGNVKRLCLSASIRSKHPKLSDSRITIKTSGIQCFS